MQSVPQAESKSAAHPDDGADAGAVIDLQKENAALEQEVRRLQQMAEQRSAFLGRLAHELRSPLTSILGFSEILLSQEELSDAQRGFCERIQNSAQQLQGSLDQLSDLSRLEAGQSEIHQEEFSLEDLLRESCEGLAGQAQKQNTKLRWEAAEDLPMVVCDRGKLRQVLSNFLAHAITRSPGAPVRIFVEKDAHGFLLKIEDEGEVPADSAAWAELDSSSRRTGSSDIGLAVARQNIGLLGGTLSFHRLQPRGPRWKGRVVCV